MTIRHVKTCQILVWMICTMCTLNTVTGIQDILELQKCKRGGDDVISVEMTPDACMNQCKAREFCTSVSYHVYAKVCYMHGAEALEDGTNNCKNFVYAEKAAWTEPAISCDSPNCDEKRMTCNEEETCTYKDCPVPEQSAGNLRLLGNLRSAGSKIAYMCSGNNVLYGTKSLTCTQNGTWSHAYPSCHQPSTVPPATTTAVGQTTATTTTVDATATPPTTTDPIATPTSHPTTTTATTADPTTTTTTDPTTTTTTTTTDPITTTVAPPITTSAGQTITTTPPVGPTTSAQTTTAIISTGATSTTSTPTAYPTTTTPTADPTTRIPTADPTTTTPTADPTTTTPTVDPTTTITTTTTTDNPTTTADPTTTTATTDPTTTTTHPTTTADPTTTTTTTDPTTATSYSCGHNWHLYQQSCYLVKSSPEMFNDIQCPNPSALAVPNTSDENDFIKGILPDRDDYWVGIRLIENTWLEAGSTTVLSFSDWYNGEPSDPGMTCAKYQYIDTNDDHRWVEANSAMDYRAVCEKTAQVAGGPFGGK